MRGTWMKILRLALPSIAAFSSMTFTGMLTLIIIGRLGPDAIAAVGISNILMYNAWALFAGINEAVNYLVSQNFGEGRMGEANERTQIALVLSVAISLLFFGASFFMPSLIFHLLGVSSEVVLAGTTYLQIRMISFCFSLLTNVLYAYMRGVGDTKNPMYISILTNVLLVALTYTLSYGAFGAPKLGLAGAAWSMVMTEGLGLILSVMVQFGKYHAQYQTRKWYSMHQRQWRLMIRESAKLSVMELSMSVGMLVFTACIARLGTTAVAANEIALNILSLGFMPANGFGAAATTLVGQEVGAKQPRMAARMGMHTVYLGMGFMALFSLYLIFFSRSVSLLYTDDAVVSTLAVSLIHIAAFIQLFDGGGIVLAGALRGAGDTTFLFRMSLVLNWVVFIPLTLVFTQWWNLGQVGAWLALCTLLVLIFVTNGWRFVRLPWEQFGATRTEGVPALQDIHTP